jgi:hypothetical protein
VVAQVQQLVHIHHLQQQQPLQQQQQQQLHWAPLGPPAAQIVEMSSGGIPHQPSVQPVQPGPVGGASPLQAAGTPRPGPLPAPGAAPAVQARARDRALRRARLRTKPSSLGCSAAPTTGYCSHPQRLHACAEATLRRAPAPRAMPRCRRPRPQRAMPSVLCPPARAARTSKSLRRSRRSSAWPPSTLRHPLQLLQQP